MKKITALLIFAFIFCVLTVSVFAANGDVIGHIYSTDIKACINGVWVDSYNIGGKTVVILEDITDNCNYNDKYRTLVCYDLSPYNINAGESIASETPGRIIGNIYETDIKTYIHGKEIPSYSLNGKMAVAIEDLGGDKEFSDILGRYFWDEQSRTIALEFAYDNSVYELLTEKHLDMNIDCNTGEITFKGEPVMYGTTWSVGEVPYGVTELTYEDKIVCRMLVYDSVYFNFADDEYVQEKNQVRLSYYDTQTLSNLLYDIEPVQPTYKDWMSFYENNTMAKTVDSLETDDYIFLFMYSPNSHGSTDLLVKLDKNRGEKVNYDNRFQSVSFWGNKDFADVRIDKENEKVYFHYDVDYVIDLKTDKIEPLENKEDLLLIAEENNTAEDGSEEEMNYKLQLTYRKMQSQDGKSKFFIEYTPDAITFSGDAEYFSGSVHSDGNEYYVLLDFEGGNYSAGLIELLRNISSGNQALPIHNEEEKYEAVNENINITINGQRAQKVAVKTVFWKGSITSYLHIRDIAPVPLDKISQFYISVGDWE